MAKMHVERNRSAEFPSFLFLKLLKYRILRILIQLHGIEIEAKFLHLLQVHAAMPIMRNIKVNTSHRRAILCKTNPLFLCVKQWLVCLESGPITVRTG